MTVITPIDDKQVIRGPGETSDRYPGVVVQINDSLRVITCSGDLQWILQRHDGQRGGRARWAGIGYFQTRAALLRLCRASCGTVNPSAWAIIDGLPENIARARS
jgi:hypothetical protein